ncbi:MAG: GNAT family N-acetyltransferase [Pseudomonadota bacterium]
MSNPVPYDCQTGSMRVFQPSAEQKLPTIHAIRAAFGMLGEVTLDREHLRPDERRLSIADSDEIIGGCFSYAYQMSLPGGDAVPVAGLGGTGISPVAQGRGGFWPLIVGHLKQSAALGDAGSILIASESGLYGRFGYGQATDMAVWQLKTHTFALRDKAVSASGQLVLLDDEPSTAESLAPIHAAACRRRAGEVLRTADWWSMIVGAKERTWFGGGQQFVAAWQTDAGELDAYALYALEDIADDAGQPGTPANRLTIRELVARSVASEVALFAALTRVSWVREIVWELAPIDPPVRHQMTDPRELRQVRRLDMSWLRPLNPVALLSGRDYLSDGEVTLRYTDPLLTTQSGYLRLSAEGGRARVERVDATADAVALDPLSLGMTVLGGTRVVELADSGYVSGPRTAVNALDRLFLTERAPFNLTKF